MTVRNKYLQFIEERYLRSASLSYIKLLRGMRCYGHSMTNALRESDTFAADVGYIPPM